MVLDTGTLTVVLAVMSVVMAGAMALLWRVHGDCPGIPHWIAANVCQTAAMAFLIFRAEMPEALSVMCGNTATASGYLLTLHGINRFTGQRPQVRTSIALLAIVVVGFAVLLVIGAPPQLRSGLISGVTTLICLLTVWRLAAFGRGNDGMREVAFIAAGINFLHAGFLAARVAVVLSAPPLGSILVPNAFQNVLFLEYTVITVLSSTMLILLSTRRLQTDLNRLAAIDGLTGCYNRRAVLELAEREIARCARSAADLAVMMIDIDHFKPLNDAHGHAAGDAVLVQVVQRAQATLRPVDLFGRYGGEEFCVVLPGLAPDDTLSVAERLRQAVSGRPCIAGDLSIIVTVSIGIAHYGRDGRSVKELVAAADQALYRAKTAGRNCAVFACTPGGPAG